MLLCVKKHLYFGYRKPIELFGQPLYTYVYADHKHAMQRFRDYLIDHQEEYEALENHEKDWYTVKFDYFVLISNIDNSGGTAHSVFLQD